VLLSPRIDGIPASLPSRSQRHIRNTIYIRNTVVPITTTSFPRMAGIQAERRSCHKDLCTRHCPALSILSSRPRGGFYHGRARACLTRWGSQDANILSSQEALCISQWPARDDLRSGRSPIRGLRRVLPDCCALLTILLAIAAAGGSVQGHLNSPGHQLLMTRFGPLDLLFLPFSSFLAMVADQVFSSKTKALCVSLPEGSDGIS